MKEIGYIKFGSYSGYKIYKDDKYLRIWDMGFADNNIDIPLEVAKEFIKRLSEVLENE